jgi:hypothetical protein
MAGYECTDKMNVFGNRVDFLEVTDHLNQLDEDYTNLAVLDIKTVREGIRWSKVEKQPYEYDWSSVKKMMAAAKNHHIQQIWDLSHFGYPDDLTPLHPTFAKRFASLCRSFVQFYRSVDKDSTIIVTPFNEVSFISWLGGEVGATVPYCRGYGWEVKYAMMKAYIEGVQVLLSEDSNIRILVTEPLINVVAELNAGDDDLETAARSHESQFQVFDILSGRSYPELGGRPEYLDIIGCNFYFNNQWVAGTFEGLSWKNELHDPRWSSLSGLLRKVFSRYGRPVMLAETSHPGIEKPEWIRYIANEVEQLLNDKSDFWGVCWYPIIDRPDWDRMEPWHEAGIWDVINPGTEFRRILNTEAAEALLLAQDRINMIFRRQLSADNTMSQ